jgi:hypothetical protein
MLLNGFLGLLQGTGQYEMTNSLTLKTGSTLYEEWILLKRISDKIYRISGIFFACGEIP